ncbi:MAG: fimbrial biogenesis outer membrane usher protein [Betaproteobacteria bacterium HGW-Betaproteobacteria-7]|nr:MAG: fimbrial biogenesis outer membrane usher protein [Betaproteobacteria bacterium HGW-Betaproteobacteria-7]
MINPSAQLRRFRDEMIPVVHCVVLLLIGMPGAALAATPESAAQAGVETVAADEIFLALRINRQGPEESVLVLRRRGDGRLLVRGEDLQHWRLRVPSTAALRRGGEDWYALDAFPGLTYQVDESNQTLSVDAPPGLFLATSLPGQDARFSVPRPAAPGGFVSYDLSVGRADGLTNAGGLFEVGAFNAWGTGSGSVLARDTGAGAYVVRLDTTWTQDRPAQLASLRIGDAISTAGSWGRSLRFGGVQWATNFATQPGLVTFPLPSASAEAVLPSTVDLFVNDALRLRREVPTGPFTIHDLPVVSGQGEARLVVRDLLGREQVISLPYYASPRLLQQGLREYSYEMGFVRNNYGIDSNDYGRFAAIVTHRVGFSNAFTGEAHGELLREQQTVGASGAWLWPTAGLFSASVAASHAKRGTGELVALGFERQSRSLSFGGNVQLASQGFTQLGLQPGELAPRQVSQFFVGANGGGYGSVAASYTRQDYRDRAEVELANASYSIRVGKLGFLSFSVLRVLSGETKTSFSLNFTYVLGERSSASVSAARDPTGNQAVIQMQRNLPPGDGMGYRLVTGATEATKSERVGADLSVQNAIGLYTLEAARDQGQTGVRAGARGSVAILGGNAFASRQIGDAFAVVQVPDYPGVRVYADNQVVARTDAGGSALVPRLRPYQKNTIRIEQADLPMDAEIDTLEQDTVPYLRSGVLLQIPVRRSRGGLLTVILDNGEALPSGAVVQIAGEKNEFPAGLKGEVYVTGLLPNNRLHISWRGQHCEVNVPFRPTSDPLPHLGTYTCTGVRP